MNDDRSSRQGVPTTRCAEVDETLGAYALGVLDVHEQSGVEAHLVACANCRAALECYALMVGALGVAVTPAPPPAQLRATLLNATRPGVALPERNPRRPRRLTFPVGWRQGTVIVPHVAAIGLSAAAALLLVAVVTMGVILDRTIDARNEARYGQGEIAEYLSGAGELAALVPAVGAPTGAPADSGTLAVAPEQPGAMLIVHGLAPTGDGRRYETWAARGGKRVALGELHVGDDGSGWIYLHAQEPMTSYETVGITRFTSEARGGEDFLIAQMPTTRTG